MTLPVTSQHQINWPKKLTEKTTTLRNNAQNVLSFIWFVQGIPRVVRMLPSDTHQVLDFFKWIPVLKPFEAFCSMIKDVGTFFELPEKIQNVLPSELQKVKNNRWKIANRFTALTHGLLDTGFLIPCKWLIPTMGAWAARTGILFPVTAAKDGLTAVAALLNAKAVGADRKKAEAMIAKCQKRTNSEGPLMQLKKIVAEVYEKTTKGENVTAEELNAIKELKDRHRTKTPEQKEEILKKLNEQTTELEKEIQKLREDIDSLRKDAKSNRRKIETKLEKLQLKELELHQKSEKKERMQVWKEKTEPKRFSLAQLNDVVVYKSDKNNVRIANAQMAKEKATISRWFDISKATVICFTYLLTLGVAAIIAPPLGLSVVTIGSLFFLGQWITGLTTGIAGVARMVAMVRYENERTLPQTHLIQSRLLLGRV